jgi:hypothetical protein
VSTFSSYRIGILVSFHLPAWIYFFVARAAHTSMFARRQHIDADSRLTNCQSDAPIIRRRTIADGIRERRRPVYGGVSPPPVRSIQAQVAFIFGTARHSTQYVSLVTAPWDAATLYGLSQANPLASVPRASFVMLQDGASSAERCDRDRSRSRIPPAIPPSTSGALPTPLIPPSPTVVDN